MSTPANLSTVGGWSDTRIVSFSAASGILAKLLIDKAPASGIFLGGQRIYDMVASSSDAATNAVTIWEGVETSLFANMGAVTTTATTNATVTRSTGSFVTDGYQAGDQVMLLNSAGASNNGNPAIVTTSAAGTLTFSGVPPSFSANTEAAGFRMFRVARRCGVAIPVASGINTVTGGITNVQLIGSTNDTTKDILGIELGALSVLFIQPFQTVSALPAVLQITAKTGLR